MAIATFSSSPPPLLKLLADDLRWKLILELAQSDRRVQELVALLKEPANLVSYHLKKLRDSQIISDRRSAADGRDVYYSLNLDVLRASFLASGAAIHPAISEPDSTPQVEEAQTSLPLARVLFLCTHNSARSQMAEGIMRSLAGNRVEVFSAGSEPQPIHPFALQAMAEIGIDISHQQPKHFDDFVGQTFDYIITVCDRVREVCPVFPGDPEHIHWSFPDPAEPEDGGAVQYTAFKQTGLQLTTRINHLLIFIDKKRSRE
jgi:protein-tyrosine-phosphatase/DNA-binding transcriptional ArsR family regulator